MRYYSLEYVIYIFIVFIKIRDLSEIPAFAIELLLIEFYMADDGSNWIRDALQFLFFEQIKSIIINQAYCFKIYDQSTI